MSKQMNELKAHRMLLLGAMAQSGDLKEIQELQRHIQAIVDAASNKELGIMAITIAYFDVMIANPELIED